MANLFWKSKSSLKSLLATPFRTEQEFEKTVFDNSELLEDIFLLKRQVRGGGKKGIPDIVGLDSDGNVCIIEMKNVPVDASILPQILEYALWAETNPDSIKSLWLEKENRPDDINVTWEAIQVRIIVIAPEIHPSTLILANKISYQVDLIEVVRWIEHENEFLLVSKLEPPPQQRVRPVSGLSEYNEEFYKDNYNRDSAKHFVNYCHSIENLVAKQNWNLQVKFNKSYCGFKAGFFNAFGVQWVTSKTIALFFKLPESEVKQLAVSVTRYESQWKRAVVVITPDVTEISHYMKLFEAAYKRLSG